VLSNRGGNPLHHTRRKRCDTRMTRDDIRSLVEQLKGIVALLNNADPDDRRAVYQELNVSITYHTDGRLHVKAGPKPCTNECVGGVFWTRATRRAHLWRWVPTRTAA
jgi:hypothetical protein